MTDLHERFRELDRIEVPTLPRPEPDRYRHEELGPSTSVGGRLVAAAVALVVAVAGIGFLVNAFDDTAVRTPRESAPGANPESLDPRRVEITVVARTEVGETPNAVAAGYGGIWVSSRELVSEGGVLAALDPSTGEVTSLTPFDSLPGWEWGGGGIATGLGAIWIAGEPSPKANRWTQPVITRVDPLLHAPTDVFPVEDVHSVADLWVDESGIWALVFTDKARSTEVRRLDPETGAMTASIPLPAAWSQTIFASAGSIWVYGTSPGDHGPVYADTLYRIDPGSAELAETVDLGESSPTIAADATAIWDRVGDKVLRIDPQGTGIKVPIGTLEERCCSLLSSDGAGGVWVLGRRGDRAVAMHVTAEGAVDGRGEAPLPQTITEGVASSFDPQTGTLWIAGYRGPVTGIRLSLTDDFASLPSRELSEGEKCERLTGPDTGASVAPAEGPSGTLATVHLAIPTRGENDQYIPPTGAVEIWWNVRPNGWPSVFPGGAEPEAELPGDVVRLGRFDAEGKCFIDGTIRVPDAPPGTYSLVALNVDEEGAHSILAADDTLRFTVAG